jgi:hypothetical protein
MKIVLVNRDYLNHTLLDLHKYGVCFFDQTGIWVYSIFDDVTLSSIPSHLHVQGLNFINEQLQLNGTIVTYNRPVLKLSKEALFRLKLTILTYKEFDFEFK